MKKLLLFLFAGLLSGAAYTQCADVANIYAFTFNGKNYEVVKELKTWTEAASCAVERGGYLLQISNVAEQNAVYDAIINGAGVSPTYVAVSNGGGTAYVWTGATDKQTEGTWLWDGDNNGGGVHFWSGQGAAGANNGVAVNGAYVNWGGTSTGVVKEPDNYGTGQNCAGIALAGWPSGSTSLGIAGEWNDLYESSQIYYIIEYDSTTTVPNTTGNSTGIEIMITGKALIISTHETVSTEICDITGRLLLSSANKAIDLSKLPEGIYLVIAQTAKERKIQKIYLTK